VHKPANDKELWAFIKAHFDIRLPFRAYSAGHSSPFGFIADAFFNPADDVAAWANRSGGKTLGASVLARLEFIWSSGLNARVLSGSQDQAKNLYEYWTNWCHSIRRDQLNGPVNMLKTAINGGKLAILPASQKAVRGPKLHRLYLDEVDEIDPELMDAAAGMVASRNDIPGRTVYTSTWHRMSGSMGRLVDGIPDNGVRLHRWNLWECIGQCPVERHEHGRNCKTCPLGEDCLQARRNCVLGNTRSPGVAGGPNMDQQAGQVADVHLRRIGRTHSEGPQAGIAAEPFGDGADSRLELAQRGTNGPGIAAEPFGIYAVADAIKAAQKVSRETWDAEYLCNRPSPQGLVYPAFDELRHVIDKPPEHLTIYRAIDWGYNAFVCLWIGVDKSDAAYILDTYLAQTARVADNAKYIKDHRIQNVAATYCDPAGRNKNDQTGRSDIDEFRKRGVHCTYRLDRQSTEVANGIRLVRNHLNPASGPPRLFIVRGPNNKAAIRAFQSYINRKVNGEYIDEPVKPQDNDHIPDALRYFFVNRMGGPSASVSGLGVS